MAIQDKSITIVGAQTVLSAVTLYPQLDGSVVVVAVGAGKDNASGSVVLKEARLSLNGVAVVDNLCARALSELRKANGLEV